MKSSKLVGRAIFLAMASALTIVPTFAQNKVDPSKLDKAKFYEAPRELQIIDNRPIIKDFREAPEQGEPAINMPPGPAGSSGLRLGGQHGDGLRTSSPALPKSGFGESNLPVNGMRPQGLPAAPRTFLAKPLPAPPQLAARAAHPLRSAPAAVKAPTTPAAPKVPTVSSYGASYSTGSGSSIERSSNQNVRGKLLGQH